MCQIMDETSINEFMCTLVPRRSFPNLSVLSSPSRPSSISVSDRQTFAPSMWQMGPILRCGMWREGITGRCYRIWGGRSKSLICASHLRGLVVGGLTFREMRFARDRGGYCDTRGTRLERWTGEGEKWSKMPKELTRSRD
jgi:hypothetical protein